MSINRYLNERPFYPQMRGNKPKVGDMGVEVEVEGVGLPREITKYWVTHADGSLRGEALEYVLNGAHPYGEIAPAIDLLAKELSTAKLDMSYRTSIHVHINASNLPLKKIINFITLYYIYEDVLFDFAGRERAGNLFCLRASDAEGGIYALRRILKTGDVRSFGNDAIRYGALNMKALWDHGSLEFRSFRGTSDFEAVKEWTQILWELYEASQVFDNPQEICQQFSVLNPIGLTERIFSPQICRKILDTPGIYDRLYDGVRIAQDIAYVIPDWSDKKEEIKEDGVAKIFKEFVINVQDPFGIAVDIREGVARAEAQPRVGVAPPMGARVDQFIDDLNNVNNVNNVNIHDNEDEDEEEDF